MQNVLPTTHFYFIRHGQTIWNSEHRYAGSSEVDLSPAANQQIAGLTEKLKDTPLDAFYSSPLSRCLVTISPLASLHEKRIIVREDLRERNLGTWEGKSPAEIHPHAGYHFPDSAYDGSFRIPEAETLEHLENRVRLFINEIHASHPGQSIAVATHAGLIWMLQDKIVSNRPHQVRWPGNCSVCKVVSEGHHYLLAGIEELV